MRKFNINRKAFTLTELIVVIAIIGILSVVMIPVLTGCIEDAKISNDTVLVANINKVLSANEILDGKNKTAHEAINDAFEAGYGIEKLTPTANGYYFMWDAENDEFVLMNESFGEIYPKNKEDDRKKENLFALAADDKEFFKLRKLGYAIYLKQNFPISRIVENSNIIINSGLDVGNNTDIENILYQNVDVNKINDVIIRTNGGKLTVNAMNETVKHYGVAIVVNIDFIAAASYHEYGFVKGTLNIKKGRVAFEKDSNVGFINITASSVDDIAIDIKPLADYGRVTAATEELLTAAVAKITTTTEIKKLVAAIGTKAIINETTYTDINDAINDFCKLEGAKLELFSDITNYDLATKACYLINTPKNGILEGHGFTLSGNIQIKVNVNGSTINNVRFYDITNNAKRTAHEIEHYQNDGAGTLTAIIASDLNGKLTITNCVFDTNNWEAIQVTPVENAEIVIENNIFMHSITKWKENRYIHIQSYLSSPGVKFKAIIKNNDFYNTDYLTNQAIEVYMLRELSDLKLENNYIDNFVKSVTDNRASCIGYYNGIDVTYDNSKISGTAIKETPNQ